MLKLIPQESAAKGSSNRQYGKRSGPKTKVASQTKLQQKFEEELKLESKIIHFTCAEFVNYMKKTEQYGAKEMGELIHNLQRSVLTLQRKRTKLLQQEERKKKDRKKK